MTTRLRAAHAANRFDLFKTLVRLVLPSWRSAKRTTLVLSLEIPPLLSLLSLLSSNWQIGASSTPRPAERYSSRAPILTLVVAAEVRARGRIEIRCAARTERSPFRLPAEVVFARTVAPSCTTLIECNSRCQGVCCCCIHKSCASARRQQASERTQANPRPLGATSL